MKSVVEGSRFEIFATYFSDKQGDIEVDSLFDVTLNIGNIITKEVKPYLFELVSQHLTRLQKYYTLKLHIPL